MRACRVTGLAPGETREEACDRLHRPVPGEGPRQQVAAAVDADAGEYVVGGELEDDLLVVVLGA